MSTYILIYIIGGLIAVVIIWIILIEYRLKKFFAGTNATSLEKVMTTLGKDMTLIKETELETKKHLTTIDQRLDKSIRNIKTIRFNPFLDAGSNQSFAISFLNDEGDGVVMSSLYARDRMSIFAKPISKGKSLFDLTDEEKEVLEKSK